MMDAAAEGLTGLLMLSLLDSGCLRNMDGGGYTGDAILVMVCR